MKTLRKKVNPEELISFLNNEIEEIQITILCLKNFKG
jgi:hypothetical protein